MIISVYGMINLTDYWLSNIVIEVDDNRKDNQEDDSDVTVKPEYWVGLAQFRFVEYTEKISCLYQSQRFSFDYLKKLSSLKSFKNILDLWNELEQLDTEISL